MHRPTKVQGESVQLGRKISAWEDVEGSVGSVQGSAGGVQGSTVSARECEGSMRECEGCVRGARGNAGECEEM